MFHLSKLKQRGQVLVFTALLLPMMILFFIAATCAGMLYIEYACLQNAADSAALAGASSYAKYCEDHLIGATSLTKPFLKAGAEKSAQEAIAYSVDRNLPDSKIVASAVDYDQDGTEQANTRTVGIWPFRRTVTESYDYTYKVTSTVALSKNVKLPFALPFVDKDDDSCEFTITAGAAAEQSFSEVRGATRLVVRSRSWDVKNSKLIDPERAQ